MNATGLPPAAQLPSSNDQMIVAVDLVLAARAAFDYFATPHLLALWWPPKAEVEMRPGGHYRMLWPSMGWELFGQFTAYEPGKHLAFTWQWVHRPDLPTRMVEAAFTPLNSGCRVTITHGVYGDTAADQEDRQSHIDGWLHFLGQLQLVANQTQV